METKYLFKYGKSHTGVLLKLQTGKPTHTLNSWQKAISNHPDGTKKTRQHGLTSQQWWNCGKKERSKSHLDLTIKAQVGERTEVFKGGASEVKDRQLKSFCDTHNRDTTLTHFWKILPTEGGLCCEHHHPWPHWCQWGSTEDKQGKELTSTLMLCPTE